MKKIKAGCLIIIPKTYFYCQKCNFYCHLKFSPHSDTSIKSLMFPVVKLNFPKLSECFLLIDFIKRLMFPTDYISDYIADYIAVSSTLGFNDAEMMFGWT